ncbi:hypothetical protein [Actinomadura algeriensis]|uniref:Uncharacterized protein n=1 Tax=Actinomadura algeriensis TaxID=1679523 RepID=A0ABR9JVJ6_9ACTN|nr:hypothetical protein [Actinomadura algeriensis]MBE1534135.1 hypothetical protein [Actinomadura algeriensis]
MRTLRCLDGSALTVVPVAAVDRGGAPFEVTLELRRDGAVFGAVGERCGFFLADVAARLAAARADGSPQAARWPDPDDRFPGREAAVERGAERNAGRDGAAARDPELFAFRYRDRGDVLSTGELRCTVRTSALWVGRHQSSAGCWRVARRAVLEAWGASGRGVRAVLTSTELVRFLDGLLAEADRLQRRPPARRTGPIPAVQSLAGAGRNPRNRRPGR